MSNDARLSVQSPDLVHPSVGTPPNEECISSSGAYPSMVCPGSACRLESSSQISYLEPICTKLRAKRQRYSAEANTQQLILQRQLTACYRGFMKQYMSRDQVIQKLQREALIKSHTGSVNALQWSTDGHVLLSGGNDSTLHLHSYPQYAHLGAISVEGGSIWDAAFLSGSNESLLAGTDTGVITISHLALLSHDSSISHNQTLINCPTGSILSVKPVERPELFFSAGADGTVRLFDTRILCTCNPGDTCNNNIILKDSNNCSLTSLAVNPANSFKFCTSHGPTLGVYDVRMCCETKRSCVQQYYIPCPRGKHIASNHSNNRITHVVYNSTGTEILVNTRTVGALLLTEDYHDNTMLLSTDQVTVSSVNHESPYCDLPNNTAHGYNDNSTHGYHENSRQCIMVCEDLSGTGSERYGDQSGFLGQLSSEMRSWLGDRPRERKTEAVVQRQSERESACLIGVYRGHRNTRTLLKQAALWGDNHVASGSDCGRIFLWNKTSRQIEVLLEGDTRVTTCIQPHPYDPVLATSGLDPTVKIWAPSAEKALKDDALISSVVEENESLLAEDEYLVPIPNTVVLRALSGVDPGDLLGGIL